MNIQLIALAKLRPSKHNVRKTGGQSIADLAASIHSTGLLQNLTVIAEGKTFEVICGSRRLAALRQLVKDGKLPGDYAAPCAVVDDTTNAIEASLAENTIREAMHPADQFDAFRTLALGAATHAEIGARFGVSELFVKQRLKLANVSPKLLMEYRTGNATLDQMQALAITDDHAAQERVWGEAEGAWQRAPDRLRNHLTEREIGDDDSRVRFIGLEAYENAGGVVRRDLFGEHAYIADEALLDRLVNAKLNSAAAGVRAEGWAWVEAHVSISFSDVWKHTSAGGPKKRALSAEEKAQIDELHAQYKTITTQMDALEEAEGEQDEWDALDVQRDEIDAQKNAILDAALVYSKKLKDASGALVFIKDGKLYIERARLKPGAKPGKDGEESTPPPAEKPKGNLSQAAVEHLYGIRTGILRNVLLNNPQLALAALISGIITTGGGDAEGVVKIRPQHTYIAPPMAAGIEAHAPLIAVEVEDFERLRSLETDWLLKMLVSLAAKHVIADHEGGEFARLAGINMAEHWQVSEEWLAKQSKAYILAALAEIDQRPVLTDKLKAAELAKIAAPLLLAEGWLPAPFREDGE